MATNGTLQLNQNYIQNGLGTLTFTVGATGNYNCLCQVTVPEAIGTGTGAGSNTGLGAGAGGGAEGFTSGDLGLGHGGVGQGFGPANGYQQPPANVTTNPLNAAVSSGLSILVKQNGTTIFTAPTLSPTQSSLQFKTSFQATAADSITIVFGSSTASDQTLNAVIANVSIGQGL